MAKKRRCYQKGPSMNAHLSNPAMTDLAKECLTNEFDRELETHGGGKVKQHPAHTFTERGVEIGPISAATRNPDGSKVQVLGRGSYNLK